MYMYVYNMHCDFCSSVVTVHCLKVLSHTVAFIIIHPLSFIAAPQVSITFTDLTQSDELTRTGTVQFTCIGTCLPYLQWFYNQTERIAEYSLINNSLHSFPLNLSILESSKLSNGAEVVMLNASQNPDTPLLADYSSMLTVHLTLLSQLGIYSIRCGTLNNYNETFINLNTTNGMLKCFYALQTQCTYIWLRDPLPISICAAI